MTLYSQELLTKREKEICLLIQSSIQATGRSPSFRQLMKLLGLSSPATIHKHIHNIKRKGYLENLSDSRRVQQANHETVVVQVPIVGSIARGQKLHFFKSTSICQIPAQLICASKNVYGFVVQDNSFSLQCILQGDLVIIETAGSSQEGELLLCESSEGIELTKFEDITETAVIKGKVSLLYRKL